MCSQTCLYFGFVSDEQLTTGAGVLTVAREWITIKRTKFCTTQLLNLTSYSHDVGRISKVTFPYWTWKL